MADVIIDKTQPPRIRRWQVYRANDLINTASSLVMLFIGLFPLLPLPALAAPFCVEQQGLPRECWYYDSRSCKQEAARRKGFCSVNLEEIVLTGQGADFCLINSGMAASCDFQSAETCNQAAEKSNAVCFENTKEDHMDPYRFDRALFRNEQSDF